MLMLIEAVLVTRTLFIWKCFPTYQSPKFQTFNSKFFPKLWFDLKYYKVKLGYLITLQMVHVGLSLNDKINLIQSINMKIPYWFKLRHMSNRVCKTVVFLLLYHKRKHWAMSWIYAISINFGIITYYTGFKIKLFN